MEIFQDIRCAMVIRMRTSERLIRDLIGQLIPFSRGNHIAHAQI